MNFYLLYEPNHALCVSTTAPKLQFYISNPRGKIIQNINFSSVSQNNDLSSKLDLIHQHESRGILDFQNRAPDIKILKVHANWDNSAYFEKHNFEQKACLPILRLPLDSWNWNVFGCDLRSWLWIPVGPACKMRQTLTVNFTICL